MSKNLSIALVVLVGLGIITGAFWFFTRPSGLPQENQEQKEEAVLEQLPLEERPYTSLTPRADGHELRLVVTKLPAGAKSMEYELVYQVESGITQGVPGNVKDIAGKKSIERDLLLGTCSSGKCRYDGGVEDGTFTLRFRNDKGKLMHKFETGFRLQQNPIKIESADGKLSISGTFPKGYYLTMGTFGLPGKAPEGVTAGPYGVFSRAGGKVSGTVTLGTKNYVYTTKWMMLEGDKTTSLGTFISVN